MTASGLAIAAAVMGIAVADAPVLGAAGTRADIASGLATADAPMGLAGAAGVAAAVGRVAGTASTLAMAAGSAGVATVPPSGLAVASRAVLLTF